MQFTILLAGLIGVLTGTSFRARALVAICSVTFVASLGIALASGCSILSSLGGAFATTFTLQFFYLVGLTLVYGKDELVRRFASLAEPREDMPRRLTKPTP